MISHIRFLPRTLVTLFVGVVALQADASTTQYAQAFTNTGGSNTNIPAGWSAYAGSSAADIANTGSSATTVDRTGLVNASGTTSGSTGFLFFNNGATTAGLMFAALTTFNGFNADTVTWYAGNSTTAVSVRLLVQQGGNWYASSTAYTTSPATSSAGNFTTAGTAVLQSLTFNPSAANWLSATITPGSTLSISGSAIASDLSSSTITGIGFYTVHTGNVITRLDDLVVTGTAIPEHSTYAATLGGLALAGVGIMRRRKS